MTLALETKSNRRMKDGRLFELLRRGFPLDRGLSALRTELRASLSWAPAPRTPIRTGEVRRVSVAQGNSNIGNRTLGVAQPLVRKGKPNFFEDTAEGGPLFIQSPTQRATRERKCTSRDLDSGERRPAFQEQTCDGRRRPRGVWSRREQFSAVLPAKLMRTRIGKGHRKVEHARGNPDLVVWFIEVESNSSVVDPIRQSGRPRVTGGQFYSFRNNTAEHEAKLCIKAAAQRGRMKALDFGGELESHSQTDTDLCTQVVDLDGEERHQEWEELDHGAEREADARSGERCDAQWPVAHQLEPLTNAKAEVVGVLKRAGTSDQRFHLFEREIVVFASQQSRLDIGGGKDRRAIVPRLHEGVEESCIVPQRNERQPGPRACGASLGGHRGTRCFSSCGGVEARMRTGSLTGTASREKLPRSGYSSRVGRINDKFPTVAGEVEKSVAERNADVHE